MNPDPPISDTAPAGQSHATSRPVPIWLLVLLLLLVFWGMVYFDQHSGWAEPHVYVPYRSLAEVNEYQPATLGGNVLGKKKYEEICALCHGSDGKGKPNQAPPFVGSEIVLGSPARLIRIPLAGLSGPITVAGQEFVGPSSMPAMGATLSVEELAGVLSYMRQSWGNKASEITPEQVKAVRGEVGNRMQPWTVQELNAFQ